jgi:hypothetical protein
MKVSLLVGRTECLTVVRWAVRWAVKRAATMVHLKVERTGN